jgi:5'-deoxynucleotidase YfbR-like HD superfamily hydrolase
VNIGFEELAKKYYRLKNLVRYQTSPRIHDENVLEHQAVTAALVAKLADDYEFDQLAAIRLALFHDYAEADISDIPHPIKKKLPEGVQQILEDIEVEIIDHDLGNGISRDLKEFNGFEIEDRSPEGKVVALADAYSVLLYSKSESALGNKDHYDNNVIPYTEKRIERLWKLLEPFKRSQSSEHTA